MKTFIATNTIIAFMAWLPSAATKEDTPHRVFRTTRSKAAKAQGMPTDSSPPPLHGEPFTESKSGKSIGAKSIKEFFPKADQELKAKASHAKCLKEDDDLFDELDLILDYSSLSMSTSMLYSGKSGKSAKPSAKCSKYDFYEDESLKELESFRCVGDFDRPGSSYPLCPGLGVGMYCDGQGDCESHWCSCDGARAFCETKLNPCDDYALEYGDDYYYYYNEEVVKDIIEFVMKMLGECAGVSLDFDTCLVKNVIEVLASGSVGNPMRKLRGAGERRMQSINATYDDDWNDDWFQCEIPTVSDIEPVIDEARGMCAYVTDDEYKTVLVSLVTTFTNEACVCGELY